MESTPDQSIASNQGVERENPSSDQELSDLSTCVYKESPHEFATSPQGQGGEKSTTDTNNQQPYKQPSEMTIVLGPEQELLPQQIQDQKYLRASSSAFSINQILEYHTEKAQQQIYQAPKLSSIGWWGAQATIFMRHGVAEAKRRFIPIEEYYRYEILQHQKFKEMRLQSFSQTESRLKKESSYITCLINQLDNQSIKKNFEGILKNSNFLSPDRKAIAMNNFKQIIFQTEACEKLWLGCNASELALDIYEPAPYQKLERQTFVFDNSQQILEALLNECTLKIDEEINNQKNCYNLIFFLASVNFALSQ
ncbi:hypothetical protein FGO68_gene3348 [Halteria grandinella]|uniref:Uncharacterized protein n=1 Tax=Halteria grandinella TaxID=5974 RepID=A0A8J8NMF5_HALGN|nr:hypothetical protein FGO68_gene3348 [Halteria grandinella]